MCHLQINYGMIDPSRQTRLVPYSTIGGTVRFLDHQICRLLNIETKVRGEGMYNIVSYIYKKHQHFEAT
jgi:hypothetical protein